MGKAVMQQALDALETEAEIYMLNDPEDGPPEFMIDAIMALRAELAKPKPKPAGYFIEQPGNEWTKYRYDQVADMNLNDEDVVRLYRKEDL